MLEFYIKENGGYVPKDIIIPATLNTTFDETLDSAEVVLKANDIETPYKPDTKCYFTDGTNRIANMIIVSDSVSRLSHGIAKYQHTLQLTQNTRLLQKHLVRNSSFSQPRDKYFKMKWFTDYTTWGGSGLAPRKAAVSADLNYKEHILINNGKCELLVETQLICGNEDSNNRPSTSTTKFSDLQYSEGRDTTKQIPIWTNISANDNIYIYIGVKYGSSHEYQLAKTITAGTSYVNSKYVLEATVDTTRTIYGFTVIFSKNYYDDTTGWGLLAGDFMRYPTTDDISSPYTAKISSVFSVSIRFEIYTWTMYDVLLTLRNQYFLDDGVYSYTEQEKTDILYGLPSASDTFGKILRNTIAPNFTFTGATLYECLAEIFKYYDAIFTLDQNNILGIEYLNEYNRNKIEATFSNKMATFSEENFTTGYISYFENALVEESFMIMPRNESLGVVKADDEWSFITPHNIDTISKFEFYIPPFWVHLFDKTYYYPAQWIDTTDYVLPKSYYSLLPKQVDYDDYSNSQFNTLTYEGNKVYIGGTLSIWDFTEIMREQFVKEMALRFGAVSVGLFVATTSGVNGNDCKYSNLKARITYKYKTDGRVRIENEETKYKGETIVNQSNGLVDLNKMGLNMLGLSYKLGQPTLAMTQNITNWNDRIVKGQIYEETNGTRWLANVVNYKFYNDKIIANINFIKNYNALSQRIQVDRQKRLSQISTDLTIKSEDNYCEYVYISSQSISGGESLSPYQVIFRNEVLVFDTSSNFNSQYRIDFACITPYINHHLINISRGLIPHYITNVYIPMTKYASGNAICFEMSLNSPITAGVITSFTGTLPSNTGYSKNALYTKNGWVDEISVDFFKHTSTDFDDNFPYIQDNQLDFMGGIYQLEYYKKPNEIFALNYELIHLVPPERQNIDFIGNALIKSNGAISSGNAGIKLFYSTDEVYSPFDLQGFGTSVSITMSVNSSSSSSMTLRFSFATIGVHTKSWSICDNQNNILFASNSDLYNKNSQDLFYSLRHYRI